MLKMTDLSTSKEMGRDEMRSVRGGISALPFPGLDFSTSIHSKVADATQGFDFKFAQANAGTVTNNQELVGGNGTTWAPVTQDQYQDNWMDVSDIGNIHVG
ncbi:hypothetical protein [Parahaliea mediterranea]|uniref:Uncharacterized protein n=1 Tax=Parahaliea mediterranea TaxID=651086 RepID=A0A939IKJ6_9GAMM|nr:hypothetical protein [Parahaliea mediterranea]MBN7795003.1 hypothetical protein [Parahaliea mediterranea]